MHAHLYVYQGGRAYDCRSPSGDNPSREFSPDICTIVGGCSSGTGVWGRFRSVAPDSYLTWYLTYKLKTSSVTRAGTVDTVMRCDATEGSSGGKLARPVDDSEPCGPADGAPLGGEEVTCGVKSAQGTSFPPVSGE